MSLTLMTELAINRPTNQQEAFQARSIVKKSEAILSNNSHLLNQPLFSSFHKGILVLNGRVRSYYKKQIAQTIVANISGVTEVVNQIEVDKSL